MITSSVVKMSYESVRNKDLKNLRETRLCTGEILPSSLVKYADYFSKLSNCLVGAETAVMPGEWEIANVTAVVRRVWICCVSLLASQSCFSTMQNTNL
jgi:hypothetical protein